MKARPTRDLTEHAQLNCIDIPRVSQSDGSAVETASISRAPSIKLRILTTEPPLTDTDDELRARRRGG